MHSAISYAQRFEDLYLERCFGERTRGFYIDVGSGHPVVDNVSFGFYRRGWCGIAVEPNPYLAQLTQAVRPRDHVHQVLVGAAPGEAAFYLVHEFHGLSTTSAEHAETARVKFRKDSKRLTLPVVTLRDLCERHAPTVIDFLKIDVEGAERDVLLGADFARFRPRIVVAEALAPHTLAPAWDGWECILTDCGYRFAFFDSLNRYYVAEEAAELIQQFPSKPLSFDAVQVGLLPPALESEHPDSPTASLLARGAMVRLPLFDRGVLIEMLTAGLAEADLARPAGDAEIAAAWDRVFGAPPSPADLCGLDLPKPATVGQIYERLARSDAFRVACGRISASYAW